MRLVVCEGQSHEKGVRCTRAGGPAVQQRVAVLARQLFVELQRPPNLRARKSLEAAPAGRFLGGPISARRKAKSGRYSSGSQFISKPPACRRSRDRQSSVGEGSGDTPWIRGGHPSTVAGGCSMSVRACAPAHQGGSFTFISRQVAVDTPGLRRGHPPRIETRTISAPCSRACPLLSQAPCSPMLAFPSCRPAVARRRLRAA